MFTSAASRAREAERPTEDAVELTPGFSAWGPRNEQTLFRHLPIHRQETGAGRERDIYRAVGKVTIAFPFATRSKGER